jgi:DNA-binding transcriptional regulator YiaG
MAGFAAAHGWARLTFTQRTIEAPLPPQNQQLWPTQVLSDSTQTAAYVIVNNRKNLGLTQRQLAAAAGIPRKWLGRWERGRALPTENEWCKLAVALNLSPAAKPNPKHKQ